MEKRDFELAGWDWEKIFAFVEGEDVALRH